MDDGLFKINRKSQIELSVVAWRHALRRSINATPSASGVPSLTTKGLTNEGKSTGNQPVIAQKKP
jgi:hypothetical protein